jgi:hypothetical protein
MHTIIAAIAGTILLQRHLKGNVIKLNIFDTATIISTPIDFEDFECLFKISFNELTFHDRVPQLIMQGISNLIYNVDAHRRIPKCIKQSINTTYQELLMLGFNISWKCRHFRCRPQLVLTTWCRVFPTRRPDTADVSATSCDVGFFFSVSYVVSLPNCRHVVVVCSLITP